MGKVIENRRVKKSEAFNENLWCNCRGTKYKIKKVSNINQAKILKISEYFELPAEKKSIHRLVLF